MSETKNSGAETSIQEAYDKEVAESLVAGDFVEVKDIREAVGEMEQDDTEFYEAIEAYKLNPPKFQCVNIPGWERTCQLNTDPYGKACLIFANEWAYNMEQIILANSHLGFNALTSEQIDECGYDEDCDLPSGNIRGVCPEGWHMPTDKDWQTLFASVGGKDKAGIALKSDRGWYNDGNGKDSFGFTALPAGNREDGGYFRLIEDYAFFWSATQYESVSSYAYYMSLYNGFDEGTLDLNEKYRGYSVRCIKD
mgnify:CR=1 FL=1